MLGVTGRRASGGEHAGSGSDDARGAVVPAGNHEGVRVQESPLVLEGLSGCEWRVQARWKLDTSMLWSEGMVPMKLPDVSTLTTTWKLPTRTPELCQM